MNEERHKEEIRGFVRHIRDGLSDIEKLVAQGVISSEEWIDIKAKRDEGDTTVTEDKKADTYDEIMRKIDNLDLFAEVVLNFLKRKE